ncbi:hypothetical protein M378DRAFT_171851 [Amanita muscaria Koide BX008]|uniref:Uncharacterized protein n=1 Tax=Amanita muscaria (strain Koide BX008) TaxID=946122 RepID=A0A0C2STH8_AMAMK|nr:hypothetical protein M378DRAFT_171851 [Amanita muscaria Koide BX008]
MLSAAEAELDVFQFWPRTLCDTACEGLAGRKASLAPTQRNSEGGPHCVSLSVRVRPTTQAVDVPHLGHTDVLGRDPFTLKLEQTLYQSDRLIAFVQFQVLLSTLKLKPHTERL